VVQLRGEGEDEGGDRLALARRCLLLPGFLSISPLCPGLSLSSPSSSVPGICCLQTKMAVWKGCSTNTASSFRLFSLWLFFSSALFPSFVFSGLSFLFLFPLFSVSKNPLSSSVSWLPPLPVHSPAFPSSVFPSSPSFSSPVSVSFSSCFFCFLLLFVRLLCFFLKKPEATSRPLLLFVRLCCHSL